MISTTFEEKVGRKTLVDKVLKYLFLAIAMVSTVAIAIITIYVVYRGSLPFLKNYTVNSNGIDQVGHVNFWNFLVGMEWHKPPFAYGVGFIILNTLYVTILSLVLAVPISILTALFIVRIAPKKLSGICNTIVELLASVPSVIYGLFGYGVLCKMTNNIATGFGVQTFGGLSTLATVLVLAIMIMPTITIISVSAIKAVKPQLITGSLALGASMAQTNYKVVLTSAKSGIFSGIILGVGRALGEATAVSMVCGNVTSGFSLSLFSTTRTLTSTMLIGLHETTGIDYDIRFSVGIVLIGIIIVTNLALNTIKNRIGRAHAK